MQSGLDLRLFRPTDALAAGVVMDRPAFGITGVANGVIAGVAGVTLLQDRYWIFFDVLDDRFRDARLLHRAAKQLFAALEEETGQSGIYSLCACDLPLSEKWHKMLGFRELQDSEKDQQIIGFEAAICNHRTWHRGSTQ